MSFTRGRDCYNAVHAGLFAEQFHSYYAKIIFRKGAMKQSQKDISL
jgi:hypothetical protein